MCESPINDQKKEQFKKKNDSFQQLKILIKRTSKSKISEWIFRLFNIFFSSAVVIYLIYKLTLIGWKNVWSSLPATVWFYIILLIIYFSLPFFQLIIYRLAFETKDKKLFWALINKRVLDKDILGYSGEMYLFLWVRKNIKLPDKKIFHILKDNVIISSAASTLMAVVLLILYFLFGKIPFPIQWIHHHFFKIILFGFCLFIILFILIKFRRRIFFLPKNKILAIFVLHNIRLLIAIGLQIIQWWVVMPQVPWVNWFTLIALQVIITRIPFLPSRDLLFLGTGIEISKWIYISSSAIAGMLLASSAINKIINLFFFIGVSISTRKKKIKFH